MIDRDPRSRGLSAPGRFRSVVAVFVPGGAGSFFCLSGVGPFLGGGIIPDARGAM